MRLEYPMIPYEMAAMRIRAHLLVQRYGASHCDRGHFLRQAMGVSWNLRTYSYSTLQAHLHFRIGLHQRNPA